MDWTRPIIDSRKRLCVPELPPSKLEAEGGCGVIGVASTSPVEGRYLLQSLLQMKNRGNGKGGGIAAVGLVPEQLGVTREILERDYLIQIAYLDPPSREQVEDEFIQPAFVVDHSSKVATVRDYRDVQGLEVRPPDVYRYFCHVRPDALEDFARSNSLRGIDRSILEDELVYQNSYRLNTRFYSSLGEKKAFVLSHGKNMVVLKLVGYCDQVIRYYRLEDFKAHVWIGHHRYPTKGRVWHPGGAHPFVGLHEALVHNGDFANYHSIMEYLAQRNIHPLFLTDTEVSVLLFDLLSRVYRYPLEYLIEAMAPTTERDFEMLPDEKKRIYRAIQTTHIHGSPDGPWFFIIARNDASAGFQLVGITDTSMLRPQVFALQEGKVKMGVIASERQAINALLRKLEEGGRLPTGYADNYWNARGGSHTDGGAFVFTVQDHGRGKQLVCTDKFGREVSTPPGQYHFDGGRVGVPISTSVTLQMKKLRSCKDPQAVLNYLRPILREADYGFVVEVIEELKRLGHDGDWARAFTIDTLTLLFDRIYETGSKKRSSLLELLRNALEETFSAVPVLNGVSLHSRLDWETRRQLRQASNPDQALIIDSLDFPSEGGDSVARFAVDAYQNGWKKIILYNLRGHRFVANGLGPHTNDVRIDCHGDVGDYVASGVDGAEVNIHGAGQDQAAQIMKYGKLVIHGDVGQAFMYAAKGGHVYVMGNAAGRPLINAVGRPKVIINGTCLDYLAESFMAGDPYNGGGYVIVNGLRPTHDGRWAEQPTPYPGSNLFSLASGGAIFIRDPHRLVSSDQLNGGRLAEFADRDWELILPHLQENERLFGISIEKNLLTVNGRQLSPQTVYRKIEPIPLQELT